MALLILVWAFQAGQSSTVIENIHTIIAAAAVKFSFDQLTHLFVLIQKVRHFGHKLAEWKVACKSVYNINNNLFLCCLELGGWKWSREAEVAQPDRTDRQRGSLWNYNWKGMLYPYTQVIGKAKEEVFSGFISTVKCESSCFHACLFRCWRCCGSWLTSPPCLPV